jgi:ubiquinone/menaquinone biosynthesis C-methylase UbiE
MADDPITRRHAFEQLFEADPDPWAFETSLYEKQKRAATIAAVAHRRYASALEVGCATGMLTAELLAVCDEIVAIDIAETALALAVDRLSDQPQITFQRAEVPSQWPEGEFDLIVLSEVLYFLSLEEIEEVSRLAYRSLRQNGVCLLVNWTGENDLPIDGETAARTYRRAMPWSRVLHEVEPCCELEVLTSK